MEERSKDSTLTSKPRPLKIEESITVSTLKEMEVTLMYTLDLSPAPGGNNGKLSAPRSSILEVEGPWLSETAKMKKWPLLWLLRPELKCQDILKLLLGGELFIATPSRRELRASIRSSDSSSTDHSISNLNYL